MLYKIVCNSSQKKMQGKGKLQGLMLIQSNPRASKVGDTLGDVSVYDDTEHLPLSSCFPRTQQQPGKWWPMLCSCSVKSQQTETFLGLFLSR